MIWECAFHHLLTKAPDQPISIVTDAYDLFKAIDTLGIHFCDENLKRPVTAPIARARTTGQGAIFVL